MKSSITTGIVLLSVFLALFSCVPFAAKETASKDKANVTTPANMTNTTLNATKPLNAQM